MISAEEYLQNIDKKSVWLFTKQKVSNFSEIINAANFFEKIPDKEHTNIEEYFAKHHEEYGVQTDRHRTLVIPQFFGLITKTPFYKRGIQYNKEKNTAVYDKLKEINPSLDSDGYNKIITEQILKFKIHAIIDTVNNNNDYHILPVIFIYKVLKELQLQFNIKEVSIKHLYTYIMTCKEYNEWEQAVYYIKNNSPIATCFQNYTSSNSRILTIIRNNIKLFNITSSSISINPLFDNYFYNNFMQKYDIDELNEILLRDVDYSYFLYNIQGFDINLIDAPQQEIHAEETIVIQEKEIIESEESDEEKDDNYIDKIDNINEYNVNPDVAVGASEIAPAQYNETSISKKYRRNPLLGRIAIQNAYYACENDHEHKTFKSAKTQKNFMEAHHLVPVKYQQKIWQKYNINVDCVENIVSLCPTCHRAFHNGTKEVKAQLIENIYKQIVPRYNSIGFEITLDEIKKLYKL